MENNSITERAMYLAAHKNSGFKVGDYVKVVAKASEDQFGWDNNWCEQMNKSINQICVISRDGDKRGFELDNNSLFPWFVLQKATRDEIRQYLIDDAAKNGFVVGGYVMEVKTFNIGRYQIDNIYAWLPGDALPTNSSDKVVDRARMGKPFVWAEYAKSYHSPISYLKVVASPEDVKKEKDAALRNSLLKDAAEKGFVIGARVKHPKCKYTDGKITSIRVWLPSDDVNVGSFEIAERAKQKTPFVWVIYDENTSSSPIDALKVITPEDEKKEKEAALRASLLEDAAKKGFVIGATVKFKSDIPNGGLGIVESLNVWLPGEQEPISSYAVSKTVEKGKPFVYVDYADDDSSSIDDLEVVQPFNVGDYVNCHGEIYRVKSIKELGGLGLLANDKSGEGFYLWGEIKKVTHQEALDIIFAIKN
jgi:hypothetical protein